MLSGLPRRDGAAGLFPETKHIKDIHMTGEQIRALGMDLPGTGARALLERGRRGDAVGHEKEVLDALEAFVEELREDTTLPGTAVLDSRDAFMLLRDRFLGLDHEEAWVLLMDGGNHPIELHRASVGGADASTLDARTIFRRAIRVAATCMVLAHNHPSGNLEPGKADLKATESLRAAADLMDIRLLDHLVVHGGRWYSFADGEEHHEGKGQKK